MANLFVHNLLVLIGFLLHCIQCAHIPKRLYWCSYLLHCKRNKSSCNCSRYMNREKVITRDLRKMKLFTDFEGHSYIQLYKSVRNTPWTSSFSLESLVYLSQFVFLCLRIWTFSWGRAIQTEGKKSGRQEK